MPREKSLPIVYALTVFILTACATAANENGEAPEPRGAERFADDPRLGEEVSRMCFASSIDSFSSNTDDTVVLEMSPNKSFLVDVGRGCLTLDSAQSIAVDSSSGCVTRGDHLIVSDSAFGLSHSSGIGPSRCLIRKMYEWNEDAAKGTDAE